jgi:hypothetical protein
MNCKVYERDIDCGHGIQQLVFVDGVCITQDIRSKTNGWYTGDGNPEFIGQTPRQIGMRVNSFKRWSNRENEWQEAQDSLTALAYEDTFR